MSHHPLKKFFCIIFRARVAPHAGIKGASEIAHNWSLIRSPGDQRNARGSKECAGGSTERRKGELFRSRPAAHAPAPARSVSAFSPSPSPSPLPPLTLSPPSFPIHIAAPPLQAPPLSPRPNPPCDHGCTMRPRPLFYIMYIMRRNFAVIMRRLRAYVCSRIARCTPPRSLPHAPTPSPPHRPRRPRPMGGSGLRRGGGGGWERGDPFRSLPCDVRGKRSDNSEAKQRT